MEEEIRNQLKVKEENVERLEAEVVSLRNISKSSTQLSNEKINQKNTMSLDKIICSQKFSADKSGVGFEGGQCSKSSKEEQQIGNADCSKHLHSKNKNNTFRRPPIQRKDRMIMFNDSFFYGYCFSCNCFGTTLQIVKFMQEIISVMSIGMVLLL